MISVTSAGQAGSLSTLRRVKGFNLENEPHYKFLFISSHMVPTENPIEGTVMVILFLSHPFEISIL